MFLILVVISSLKESIVMYKAAKQWQPNFATIHERWNSLFPCICLPFPLLSVPFIAITLTCPLYKLNGTCLSDTTNMGNAEVLSPMTHIMYDMIMEGILYSCGCSNEVIQGKMMTKRILTSILLSTWTCKKTNHSELLGISFTISLWWQLCFRTALECTLLYNLSWACFIMQLYAQQCLSLSSVCKSCMTATSVVMGRGLTVDLVCHHNLFSVKTLTAMEFALEKVGQVAEGKVEDSEANLLDMLGASMHQVWMEAFA